MCWFLIDVVSARRGGAEVKDEQNSKGECYRLGGAERLWRFGNLVVPT